MRTISAGSTASISVLPSTATGATYYGYSQAISQDSQYLAIGAPRYVPPPPGYAFKIIEEPFGQIKRILKSPKKECSIFKQILAISVAAVTVAPA
jgi:hypothetical protein